MHCRERVSRAGGAAVARSAGTSAQPQRPPHPPPWLYHPALAGSGVSLALCPGVAAGASWADARSMHAPQGGPATASSAGPARPPTRRACLHLWPHGDFCGRVCGARNGLLQPGQHEHHPSILGLGHYHAHCGGGRGAGQGPGPRGGVGRQPARQAGREDEGVHSLLCLSLLPEGDAGAGPPRQG